jgi:DNA-binding transcriptional LysR family regulator
MDRLDAMATLLAAVEGGSLSAASRKLGMPLATVSRKVSDLEAHLRTKLVNRTSRQLTLTDAGRSYAAACKRILEEVGEAERAATGEYSVPRGDLTISASIVFGRLHVLPLTADFLKAYPDINIRLVLTDRIINMAEEHVDLAVRIGSLPDSSLMATRVGSIRRVICASPAYLSERGTPRTPAALSAHDCVTFEGLTAPDVWGFPGETKVRVKSRLSVNTAEAAIDAAAASIGVTRVLSYQAAAPVRAGALDIVLIEFEPEPLPVHLVYSGQGLLPLKIRAFLDFAGPRLKQRLSTG